MRLITLAIKCKEIFERLYLLLQLPNSVEIVEPMVCLEYMVLLIILHANQEIVDQPDKKAKTNYNKHCLTELFPWKRLLKAHYSFFSKVFPNHNSLELRTPSRSLSILFLVVYQYAIFEYSFILYIIGYVLHCEVVAVIFCPSKLFTLFTLRLLFDTLWWGCSREHYY
jgi:hypothetical protein